MREVLMVYQEVPIRNERQDAVESLSDVITVSLDEKPSLKVIANTAPDLPPLASKHPKQGCNHE
jgi:hypothetical protein